MLDNRKPPVVAVVSPCYNEEEALPHTLSALTDLMEKWKHQGLIALDSYIFLVDDGCKDRTWDVIEEAHRKNPQVVKGLKLAQNVGHQKALFAGLNAVKDKCDCAISIDADLQDDVNAIAEMVQMYREGRDIVFGVRKSRDTDTFFKKWTAQVYYRLLERLGIKAIYNHADYRLMSKRALQNFCQFQEYHLYLRGLALLTSKNYGLVYYDRNVRVAGESKYPIRKMLSFAWNGISSFSAKPMQFIAVFGLISCLFSIIMGGYSLYRYAAGHTIEGWTSIFISIYFLGGVQLLSLGIIGQYVGKIFLESKRRPHYFEEKLLL